MALGHSSAVVFNDVPPLLRDAINGLLAEHGFLVDEPVDIHQWVNEAAEGAVVVIQLSDGTRIARIRQQRPDFVVVALVPESTTAFHALALRAGANTAIGSDATADMVVTAVEAGLIGMSVLPTETAVALASNFPSGPLVELTDQELGWIRALAANKSIESLAEESAYSSRHFKRILKRVYGRLGASSRTEALMIAARRGLLSDR